jgi:regulatory protein
MRRPPPRRADRSAPPAAMPTAVRLLARREYGRSELRARLCARGIDAGSVDAALDELQRRGLLSDARYAGAVVAQKAGRYGRRAIAYALKEKGIEAAAADAALAQLEGRDEVAEALALLRRRYDKPPENRNEKARQVRFLLSRGYPMSVALKALRLAGAPRDEDEG